VSCFARVQPAPGINPGSNLPTPSDSVAPMCSRRFLNSSPLSHRIFLGTFATPTTWSRVSSRIGGSETKLDRARTPRRSSIYPRSCSRTTSDEVVREDLYTCGMTVTAPLRKRVAIPYGGLPSTDVGGTIRTNWLVVPAYAATKEKNLMINPPTHPASAAPREAHVRSSGKRIVMAIATLLLAAGFVFVGTSTATAEPTFTSGYLTAPCRGEKPGFCPGVSETESAKSGSMYQPDDLSTTTQSNEDPVSR